MLSGFKSFEAPDPAKWTARGYAIVNVDSRGVVGSEGKARLVQSYCKVRRIWLTQKSRRWWGSEEGRDGFGTFEYIAQLPWCSGKCALVGNSWLTIAQWFIAAEQPSHIACIASLEGTNDLYCDTICRGGILYKPFWKFLTDHGMYDMFLPSLFLSSCILIGLSRAQQAGRCSWDGRQISPHERILGGQTSQHRKN